MVDIALCQGCNNSCVMCTTVRSADLSNVKQYYPSKEEILERINRLESPDYIALTGGEPTLRVDLVEILGYILKKFPETEITLLTNGRRLAYMDYCKRLVKCGVRKFIIPIHAHEAELHDFITRTSGSFEQAVQGIKNLVELNANVEVRIVVHGINYPFLPEIARLTKREFKGINRIVFLYFDAIGSGSINKDRLFVKQSWVVPYLQRAIDELEGYDVKVYHFPSCVLDENYRKYSLGKTVEESRIMFKEECKECKLITGCSGIWKTYGKNVGVEEFRATKNEKMDIKKYKPKRIVLVWPLNTYYTPSISVLYQSKVLERAGYEVSVVFSNLLFSRDNLSAPREFLENPAGSMKTVVDAVAKHNPEFVVVDSWREHSGFLIRFVEMFKDMNPEVKLIITGHNPTFIPDEVLRLMPRIDYLVRGEAEFTIVELIGKLSKNEEIESVKGISFWKDKKIIHTEKRVGLSDLDDLPFIDFENVIGNIPNRFELRSSRGCVGKCSFCSLPKMGGGIRFHSTEYMIKQISHLRELYDFDYLHFIDEMFLCKPEHSRKLAEGIGEKFPELKWGAMLRSDLIRKEIIEIMSRNGFNNTVLGVESVSASVLEYLNKSKNPAKYIKEIPKAIEIVSENVKTLELGLIVGTPVETREDILKLGEFVEETKKKYEGKLEYLRFALGKLVVYPGTSLWGEFKAGRLKLVKEERGYNKFEDYFYKEHSDLLWVAPWYYTCYNNNFKDQDEFKGLIGETMRRWGN